MKPRGIYKRAFVPKGDSEWLRWRQYGVGASDIVIIRGLSPHKTRFQLYGEKVLGKETPISQYVQQVAEDKELFARIKLYNDLKLKVPIEPLCVESVGNSRYRASLDGYSSGETNGLHLSFFMEHKCVSLAFFNYVSHMYKLGIEKLTCERLKEYLLQDKDMKMRAILEQMVWQFGIIGKKYADRAYLSFSLLDKKTVDWFAVAIDFTPEVRKLFRKVYRAQLMAAMKFLKHVDKMRHVNATRGD